MVDPAKDNASSRPGAQRAGILRRIQARFASLSTREGMLLLAVLIVVAGTWGFIALADAVREGGTRRIDDRINHYCYTHPGPRYVQDAGRDLTALGGVTVLTLVVLAVIGYLLLNRLRGMTYLVIAATLGALLLTSALKRFIDRPRPPERQASVIVYTKSFPSGHSALSAAIYLTLGGMLGRTTRRRAIKVYFVFIALCLTFLIGCSRVYLGAHYPTDVLAGWTVGLCWAILCWIIARELQKRRLVEAEAKDQRA